MIDIDQIARSIAYCEYSEAEVCLRENRHYSNASVGSNLFDLYTRAINETRRHHILGCLRILRSIQGVTQK